jgi:hypothetical protein
VTKTTAIQTLRRTAAQRVLRLTPEQALALVHSIRAEGATIFHPAIAEITGGYVSQNINFYVVRLLAKKAGLIL